MEQTFPTPEPVELFVQLDRGGIEVSTAETEESRIEITGPRAEDFNVEHRGRHLAVIPPRDRGGLFGHHEDHRVRVRVPHRSGLVTKTGSADLEAGGTYSLVRVKTGSGDVDVDTVTGPAVIESGSGDVSCTEASGDLRVKTGSGDVEVGQAGGTAAISTGSGDVQIGRTAGRAVVKSGSGDVLVNRAGTHVSLSSGSGDLDVGHADRGELQAKSASGSVHVGIAPGTPVWTDVTSVSGRIGSNLPPVGKPEDGEEHLRVKLRTVSGDIVLSTV